MARQAFSQPDSGSPSTAEIGFEANLWFAADKVRNNMDAAEPERSGDSQPQAPRRASEARRYKHVALGLIFIKYISDTFEELRNESRPFATLCGNLLPKLLSGASLESKLEGIE